MSSRQTGVLTMVLLFPIRVTLATVLGIFSLLVVIAMIKHHDKRQFDEERVCFALESSSESP